jgi:basic amino acid/polyamine antiporter, APA family
VIIGLNILPIFINLILYKSQLLGNTVPSMHTGPGLKRSITLFQAVMYGIGLILGAGIYVLIGDVAAIAGNAMWISFLLAAVMASLTGLSYAELSSIFPKSAAEYVYVKEGIGNNFVALFVGCLTIFVAVTSAATVAIGFSSYLAVFLPQYPPILYGIALVLVLSFLNYYGIRESVWVNSIFTLVEVSGLLIIIAVGLSTVSVTDTNYFEMPSGTFSSHAAIISTFLASTLLVFFAYYGFENISNISEETKNPTRTIPRALLFSILVTTIIYILVAISTVALVGWEELSRSNAPLALAASKVLGNNGIIILTILALFATTNTFLMMLISGSRIIFGLAKYDDAIPTILAEVHSSRKTPWLAIIFTMAFTLATIILYTGKISDVASISVFSILLVFALVNLSVIRLRFKHPRLSKPFTSPFSVKKFPILPMIGLVIIIVMMIQFNPHVISSTLIPLISIIILCLILTKRNTVQN